VRSGRSCGSSPQHFEQEGCEVGLFDGVISQAQTAFDQEFATKLQPLFNQALAELQADRASDQHLDASVQSLQHSIEALAAMQRATLAQMRAVNAHPAVAKK
jgi:hypothetical protein